MQPCPGRKGSTAETYTLATLHEHEVIINFSVMFFQRCGKINCLYRLLPLSYTASIVYCLYRMLI